VFAVAASAIALVTLSAAGPRVLCATSASGSVRRSGSASRRRQPPTQPARPQDLHGPLPPAAMLIGRVAPGRMLNDGSAEITQKVARFCRAVEIARQEPSRDVLEKAVAWTTRRNLRHPSARAGTPVGVCTGER
jgi:hypothetical protein